MKATETIKIDPLSLKGFKMLFILPPFEKEHKVTPPNGIGYLAGMLEANGAQCFYIDAIKDCLTVAEITQKAKFIQPQLIGISLLTPMYKNSKTLIQALKQNGFYVVVGGPHASALPRETLLDTCADYLIFGEGEITLQQLCQSLHRSVVMPLAEIDGLAFKQDDLIIVNQQRPLIQDIDSLPFPAWHLFPPDQYPFAPQGTMAKRYPVAAITTSRGCPFNCAFCSTNVIWRRKFRARSAKNVVDEIELLVRQFRVREIHFIDDNLTTQSERVYQICDELDKRGLKIVWSCPNGVRIDSLDINLVRRMKKSGCYSLTFGIEAGNQEILNRIRKKITLQQVEEVVTMVKNEGIETRGFFIVGLPSETRTTIRQTIDFAKKLPLSFAGFSIFVLMPGLELFKEWVQQNHVDVTQINWDRFDSYHSQMSFCAVSQDELIRLCRRANLEFYLRPHILFGFLKYVRQTRWMVKRLLHYY